MTSESVSGVGQTAIASGHDLGLLALPRMQVSARASPMDMGKVLLGILYRLCHLEAIVMGKYKNKQYTDSNLGTADNLHPLEKRHTSDHLSRAQS